MVSKGIFCLLALFLLVKSSQQRANEELQDLQARQSSQSRLSSHELQLDSSSSAGTTRTGQADGAVDDERSGASASANANAVAQLQQYPGPYNPIGPVNPIIPGGGGEISCIFDDQVINAVVNGDCAVCVCVRRHNALLEPVCGACGNCVLPPPTQPPTQNPWWPTEPPTLPPTVVPNVPKCDPLPTNQQFQNPLDPCQICICQQVPDMFGNLKEPVIECQRNPNCVSPPPVNPDPKTNPVKPPSVDIIGHAQVILNQVCKVYPNNVWFKNPVVACELCACIPEPQIYGPPLTVVTCYRDPSCDVPTPEPTQVNPTLPPSPQPPLPGPPPHQSCRPYTPNVPFDHPWDQCQSCVCSEYFGPGVINIEINCHTKKECCLEFLPYPQVSTQSPPLPYIPTQQIPIYGGGSSSSYANAGAYADSGLAESNAEAGAFTGGLSPYSGPYGQLSQSSAEASSNANVNWQNGNNGLIYPGQLPFGPSGQSSAAATASATSNVNGGNSGRPAYPSQVPIGPLGPLGPLGPYAPSSAQSSASATSNVNGGGGRPLYPGQYGPLSGQSSADASAIATSNVNGGGGGGMLPFYPGQYGSLSGQSSAEASASANTNVNGGNNGMLLYPGQLRPQGQSSAEASGSATANSGSYGGFGGVSGYGPVIGGQLLNQIPQLNSLGQANAVAEANAQAQAAAQAQAVAQAYAISQAQAQAAAQTQAQQLQVNSPLIGGSYPVPYPGGYSGGGNSQAQASANAQASGGESSQAVAQAYAAAQKSGEVEDESSSS